MMSVRVDPTYSSPKQSDVVWMAWQNLLSWDYPHSACRLFIELGSQL